MVNPNRLHPRLIELLERYDILTHNILDLPEDVVAGAVALAIQLMNEEEQTELVSRFMTEREIAEYRLREMEMEGSDVVVTGVERELLLRDEEGEEGEGGDEYVRGNEGGDCVACDEHGSVTANCGCHYCRACLRRSIRTSLRSLVDYPPRCCKPFDEATIRAAGSPPLLHLFRQMGREAATAAQDRVYCCDGHCAIFIPADDGEQCPSCGLRTCRQCRQKVHEGPCWQGRIMRGDMVDIWAEMDRTGAVNCPRCGIMIQLRDGCNHMTCLCGQEFCYLCGSVRWRECTCPLYNSYDLRLPLRRRPGARPYQWQPRGSGEQIPERGLMTIPQLRPETEWEMEMFEAGQRVRAEELGGEVPAEHELVRDFASLRVGEVPRERRRNVAGGENVGRVVNDVIDDVDVADPNLNGIAEIVEPPRNDDRLEPERFPIGQGAWVRRRPWARNRGMDNVVPLGSGIGEIVDDADDEPAREEAARGRMRGDGLPILQRGLLGGFGRVLGMWRRPWQPQPDVLQQQPPSLAPAQQAEQPQPQQRVQQEKARIRSRRGRMLDMQSFLLWEDLRNQFGPPIQPANDEVIVFIGNDWWHPDVIYRNADDADVAEFLRDVELLRQERERRREREPM